MLAWSRAALARTVVTLRLHCIFAHSFEHRDSSQSADRLVKTFLRLFRFVRPYSARFVLLVVLNVILGAFGALTMAVIKPVMGILFEEAQAVPSPAGDASLNAVRDSFFSGMNALLISATPSGTLLNLSIFIVMIFLVKNITKYISGVNYFRMCEMIVSDMRTSVFDRLLKHSLGYFHANKTGELISLVTNEINAMHGSLVPFFMQLVRSPVEIILLLALLLSLSVKLTLIAMSTSVITLIIIRISRTYLRRYATRMADSTAGYVSTLQETISAVRIVKAFSAEPVMSNRFAQQALSYMRSAVKLARIHEAIPTLNEVFAIAALSVVLYLGGHEVFAGKMRGSDLMTFLFALFAIMAPTVSLVSIPGQIQRGIVAAERVFDVIDTEPALKDGSRIAPAFTGSCEFKNVRFAYGADRPVLHDISLTIPKGSKVALVGSSGSGKSTLIDLLVRFYDPLEGAVHMDGRDVREFTMDSYRRRFGIVSQDTVLFHDTVANNISFGASGVSRTDIEAAARIANAHEFIMTLPQGYETIVGDRGVLLSGGQRQRIAIARAIAQNPDILIFDEATSALDSASESIVQHAINDVLSHRTAVIIAHRLSTIVNCDNIVVLDRGRIAEQGTHEQLLRAGGIYAHLYAVQFNQQTSPSAA